MNERTACREEIAASCGRAAQQNRQHLGELFSQAFPYDTRVDSRRMHNLIQARADYQAGTRQPRAFPVKLTVEANNICNLRCPACFTGVREIGRARGEMPLELFDRIIDELGPYLLQVEFFNWGEPLLCRGIFDLIERASRAGISTNVCTNFSFAWDAQKASRLITSGLGYLAVSIDGARQETYEQYRQGGDLALVLSNIRIMTEMKRQLASDSPRIIWVYHVFPHNYDEIPMARRMARELGVEIVVSRAWTVGEEWTGAAEYPETYPAYVNRCQFLWFQTIINNDGGVAPCCATFYKEHDLGTIESESGLSSSVMSIWRGSRFTAARELFESDAQPDDPALLCSTCPQRTSYRQQRAFVAAGGAARDFRTPFTNNDFFNFFWPIRPEGSPKERGVVRLRRSERSP